jgi:hypothetical protein
VDLERPERFWHMLLQSQGVHEVLAGRTWDGPGWLIMFKPWSPMSVGAWALLLFGVVSFVSFLSTVWPHGWLDRLLHRRWFGHAFQFVGSGLGFFVAAYTGALLTAGNQPLWAQTEWIAPLFLTSAASTGVAALLLLGRRSVPAEVWERLEKANLYAVALELCVFVIFVASLSGSLWAVWYVWPGKLLLVGVPVLGLLVPLALHLGRGRGGRWRMPAALLSALLGGFLLRYAIVTTPPVMLAHSRELLPRVVREAQAQNVGTPPALFRISPEDGRPRDGGPGASALNRGNVVPRSRVFETPNP